MGVQISQYLLRAAYPSVFTESKKADCSLIPRVFLRTLSQCASLFTNPLSDSLVGRLRAKVTIHANRQKTDESKTQITQTITIPTGNRSDIIISNICFVAITSLALYTLLPFLTDEYLIPQKVDWSITTYLPPQWIALAAPYLDSLSPLDQFVTQYGNKPQLVIAAYFTLQMVRQLWQQIREYQSRKVFLQKQAHFAEKTQKIANITYPDKPQTLEDFLSLKQPEIQQTHIGLPPTKNWQETLSNDITLRNQAETYGSEVEALINTYYADREKEIAQTQRNPSWEDAYRLFETLLPSSEDQNNLKDTNSEALTRGRQKYDNPSLHTQSDINWLLALGTQGAESITEERNSYYPAEWVLREFGKKALREDPAHRCNKMRNNLYVIEQLQTQGACEKAHLQELAKKATDLAEYVIKRSQYITSLKDCLSNCPAEAFAATVLSQSPYPRPANYNILCAQGNPLFWYSLSPDEPAPSFCASVFSQALITSRTTPESLHFWMEYQLRQTAPKAAPLIDEFDKLEPASEALITLSNSLQGIDIKIESA